MRSVLVDQSLRWVAEEKLRDDDKADVFLTIKSLLKNVAPIAVSRQLDNTPAVEVGMSVSIMTDEVLCVPHASNNLATFLDGGGGFQTSLYCPVTEPVTPVSALVKDMLGQHTDGPSSRIHEHR